MELVGQERVVRQSPWPHPARLPLAGGWSGQCTAPGHEGEIPAREVLEQFCNLGYAKKCGRLPQERVWDAVRFAVASSRADVKPSAGDGNARRPQAVISLQYICELEHRPAEFGTLQFDAVGVVWIQRHADPRVQKMAECFMEAHLGKMKSHALNGAEAERTSN